MSGLSYLLLVPAAMLMYAFLRGILADGLCREASKCARKKRFHEALDLYQTAEKVYGQSIQLARTSILLIALIALAIAATSLWPQWFGGAR